MQKYAYWIATGLVALIYAGGGAYYLVDTATVKAAWVALGFPAYLVPIMGVVKLAAAVVILWRPNRALADLAYAGIFFHLLLAISAHVNAGDFGFPPAVVGLIALLVSFFTQAAARNKPSLYVRPLTS